ncbi:hypothetical protein [Pseudobacteriovorax antillogorgiicola]|uniref:PilZ domain-containing protein n=1 Tax=Pseudobacteriovorax antillogorgiicola TaxID=1513793 RepID=A0A1Y6C0H5_9BACT|nr:hypothetical protein [Pseudobacteriovorax antillogorgiicola]TCS52319.1 hypothetical protein EDD56_10963 [Pseudobacteriovorax antillogorgiicola]SMF30100.1 hypothetical protein SAMN06296036_109150 [Pseudobacteriovorax antillogorgiicola]
MGAKEDKSPRNYFRLEYPNEVRPRIFIDKNSYPVINLCEGGVKFAIDPRKDDVEAERVHEAVIVFHNSDQTEVIGKVIRSEKDSVVLKLSEGVPLQQIMAEQRFLLNKYGTLRRPLEEK